MTEVSIRRFASSMSAAIVLVASLGFSAIAHGGPLGLIEKHPGDVTTHFTSVDYTLDADPATGTLTATGFPDEFDVGPQNVTNGSFSLVMKVKRSDGSPISGSLSISGDTDGVPHFTGSLLVGTISQFGFPNGPFGSPAEGNIFEFVADVTGGALAGPYYSSGKAGIIMNISNGSGSANFTGSFTTPFSNDGFSGSSDTFSIPRVPEPSSIFLSLVSVAMLLAWRSRRLATAA